MKRLRTAVTLLVFVCLSGTIFGQDEAKPKPSSTVLASPPELLVNAQGGDAKAQSIVPLPFGTTWRLLHNSEEHRIRQHRTAQLPTTLAKKNLC